MFDILDINLTNFRAFAGTHKFTFPTEPGLYNLTGRNEVNPRLEANGVGKSTLLEAIYWCLYGHTSRGLKAGDVISRGKKSCIVSVHVAVGQFEGVITRSQSPNALTINDTIVEQTEIDKLLRLSPGQFSLSVMLPQFGSSFLDRGPTDKLALFSQIMELDFWLEKSKAADVLAKELAEAKEVEERKLASLMGRISSVDEDCKGLEAQQATFFNDQRITIQGLDKKIKQLRTEHKSCIQDLEFAKAGRKAAENRSVGLTKVIQDHYGEIDAVIQERQRLATKAAVLEASLQTLNASMKKLTGLGAVCPTCLQTVNANHLKAEKARLKSQIETSTLAYEAYEKPINKLAEQRATIAKANSVNHEGLATVTRNKVDFETKEAVLKNKIEHNILEQEQLEKQIGQERKRENPYTKMLADKRTALTDLKTERAECKAQIASLNEDHAAVSYWVGGFKRVRLFLIEETLRQLEIEVNNSLTSLGLVDWRIEFDIERENKTGGVTKGFVVFIYAPEDKEPMRYEAWSGGETQRLRLAGNLGLANLIMERAGLTSTIEFYDEPSKGINPMGLLDLAETLYQRAIDTGKRIFLVDHHTIDFGDFSGVICVIKDEKGSRLEYST